MKDIDFSATSHVLKLAVAKLEITESSLGKKVSLQLNNELQILDQEAAFYSGLKQNTQSTKPPTKTT